MLEWLSDAQLSTVEYSEYWNDEQRERGKAFYVLDGDFERMERYLAQVGLPQDLDMALEVLEGRFGQRLGGTGIDLAAGTLWAAPRLLRAAAVRRLYCLDYSRHRLLTIGPAVLDHYQVPKDAAVLVWGSFNDLRLDDGSLDFVFLSQALHHAAEPDRLLAEIKRVLKPDGSVIVIGEHSLSPRLYAIHYAKLPLSLLPSRIQRKLLGRVVEVRWTLRPRPTDLHPPDEAGDHVYTRREYTRLFDRAGFDFQRFRRGRSIYQGFVLVKR